MWACLARSWGLQLSATTALTACLTLLVTMAGPGSTDQGSYYEHQCHEAYYHLPECINHPDSYGCRCGPGFTWNSRMCVAAGLDSHFNFENPSRMSYTKLLNKAVPELTSFTIAFWIKLNSSEHPGTILSYSDQDGVPNVLRVTTGPSLTLKVQEEEIPTLLKLNASQWTHLAWTWMSKDGSWRVYVNGGRQMLKGRASRSDRPITGGGDLVLGQASSTSENGHHFDPASAFVGEMAFINIWRRAMRRPEIRAVYEDCQLMRCGDAVEWADFRSGTRGAVDITWPSSIYKKPCFDEIHYDSCDRHCSIRKGAQCNEEVKGNVLWRRTLAGQNASEICPGSNPSNNDTRHAYRECFKASDTVRWGDPVLDQCTLQVLLELQRQMELVVASNSNESRLLEYAEHLEMVATTATLNNPVDLATILHILDDVIKVQRRLLETISRQNSSEVYGLDRRADQQGYPTVHDTTNLTQIVASLLNGLLADKNTAGWLAAQPKGQLGNDLLLVLKRLDLLLVHSIDFHISRGEMLSDRALLSIDQGKIAYELRYQSVDSVDAVTFPRAAHFHRDDHPDTRGYLSASVDALLDTVNMSNIPDHIFTSAAWFRIGKTVPNRNLTGKYTKEDNVNSALFFMNIHNVDFIRPSVERNLTEFGVEMQLVYLDNFNISNPECVRLVHGNRTSGWYWSREGCQLAFNTSTYSVCHCRIPGVFAVLTDMYNVEWDRGEKPIKLMDIPSYIGCSLSALLCLMSIILLLYYRTSSKTAALHKNFAMSIIFSQLSFMFGVDRVQNELVCHAFAIGFHYFFLATFSWLMNEAFNLYIVITYAAHSHGEHTEGGSQWRYYILGWILPAILVGAFVGTHKQDYYADDMCWISWQYVWLFLGPAIGIISVTVMVLIFIAKEHHESAYSKNEQTNNMIIIYSKALWTQTILITLCWSFAFLSIKMRGIIIKCLYALFNSLQGAFFIVFYFLLHDEVQTIIKARVKKKTLASQGYDYSNASSCEDGIAFAHEMEEMNSPGISGSSAVRKHENANRVNARPKLQYSSDEDDEDSDNDVIVTSV